MSHSTPVNMDDAERETVFVCRRCGSKGEQYFSWDGYCLMCEDDDNGAEQLDFLDEDEHL